MKTTDKTTITPEADAVKPLRPSLPDEVLAHHYQWIPEGDGFTLYRMRNGQMGRNCGRLNTDATGSTNRLAQLYNAAPDLLARCERSEGDNILDAVSGGGHPFLKRPRKRKNPVTLIVGLICRDGIVLAADSQTTKGTAKQLGANKISIIEFANGKAAVAESGSASLSNAAIQRFRQLASGRQVENELTIAKTAEESVREILSGITAHLNPYSPDNERQDFLFNETNYFELMVAYYFGNKPRLYILKSAWCIPVPAASFFLTSGIAGDLANYILQEHTSPSMDKDLASIIAIKTVKDAIDYVEGCGLPIRLAMVHKPYRKRPFHLSQPQEGKPVEEIHGQVTIEPSWIQTYEAEKVEGISNIISRVEQNTKASRNKSLHKALQDQSKAHSKKLAKAWEVFCKQHPDLAAEAEARIARTGEAYHILPDEE